MSMCVSECVTSHLLAVKLSDGAGLSNIDHDEWLQAQSTDSRVHDSATDTTEPRIYHAVYLLDNGGKV